jgi:hypothetical protein
MRASSILLPARFLITAAHLIIAISIFFTLVPPSLRPS